MEMTIEPPPVTNLTDGAVAGGGTGMSYGDLKNTMADLTNSFQNGSFASSLASTMNISVNTMETQEPLYVPQPEDMVGLDCIPQDDDPEGACYLGPEDNASDGVPWSVASQANATARLEESLNPKALQMPTELVIGSQQPFTANEMSPMDPKPTLYMKDQNGDTVNDVGTNTDPWIVTAMIASGSGALANNLTCAFEQGLCVFENLAIDTMGEDYTLSFELTYPNTETVIPPVVSDPFDVEGRVLSTKFTQLNTLSPVNQTFTAIVSVWDDALDMEADVSSVPAGITCTLSLMGVDGVELMGTLDVAVTGSQATFADLQVPETISSAYLGANCGTGTAEFVSYTISDLFNVHPYPKTGSVREATADFTYSGPVGNVDDVLNAFAATLGTTMNNPSNSMMKRSAEPAKTFTITMADMASWPEME